MSDDTGISWTNATWNPIRGCTRVSDQRIREGALPDGEYRALLADALAELLAAVELAAGASVAECFAATAPTVLARDWSADRAGGGR